jgi:4-amino-4-deoxy-L-arabinose transferase-like glycosyltransferase
MVSTTDAAPARAASSVAIGWWLDATVLTVATVLLRLAAFLAAKSLVFDDGVYAASALAMRAGAQPFRDVFSSQGPLFLPLVWLGDLAGFRTIDSPRVLTVVSGVVLAIAVYAIGRRITSRGNALLAAALVTTSGSILWVTVPVNSDGPSLACSMLAVALAVRYRDRPSTAGAVGVGLAAGVALSIKLLAAPAVLIAGLVVLLSHRRTRDAAAAAAFALGVCVVAALPWGVGRVWDQTYVYHSKAHRVYSGIEAARKVLNTLAHRDLLLLVALGLALAALVVRLFIHRPRSDTTTRAVVVVLVAWVVLVFVMLVSEPAMWRAHVSHLVPPLALLAALHPPPWPVLAAGLLVAVPFAVSSNTSILWPDGYTGDQAALVHQLERLPHGALVISDDPGWVWRAKHRTPAAYADTSYQRVDAHDITEAKLVRAASAGNVCAVVASSPARFLRFRGLSSQLARAGYDARRLGPRIALYERPRCVAS